MARESAEDAPTVPCNRQQSHRNSSKVRKRGYYRKLRYTSWNLTPTCSMNNLAALLFDQSDYEQARVLLEDAMVPRLYQNQKGILTYSHLQNIVAASSSNDKKPSYASILNNLASVYEKVWVREIVLNDRLV